MHVTRWFAMLYCVPMFVVSANAAAERPARWRRAACTPASVAVELDRELREVGADDVAGRSTPPRMSIIARAVVVLAVLVPAHELQPHRRAGEVRDDRRRLARSSYGAEP